MEESLPGYARRFLAAESHYSPVPRGLRRRVVDPPQEVEEGPAVRDSEASVCEYRRLLRSPSIAGTRPGLKRGCTFERGSTAVLGAARAVGQERMRVRASSDFACIVFKKVARKRIQRYRIACPAMPKVNHRLR